MNELTAPSPLLNLAVVIHVLRGAVGAWVRPGWLSIPLVLLLHRRLGQIERRVAGLVARFQAGRLWRPAPRARREAATGGVAAVSRRSVKAPDGVAQRLPGRFGWLVWAAGYHAAGYGSQLRHILEQPEMAGFLEAAPQVARLLRPLCRMLAIETVLLRPGGKVLFGAAEAAAVPVEKPKRVRKKRPPIDWGRIPLPRGVLSAARRQGFGKLPRG